MQSEPGKSRMKRFTLSKQKSSRDVWKDICDTSRRHSNSYVLHDIEIDFSHQFDHMFHWFKSESEFEFEFEFEFRWKRMVQCGSDQVSPEEITRRFSLGPRSQISRSGKFISEANDMSNMLERGIEYKMEMGIDESGHRDMTRLPVWAFSSSSFFFFFPSMHSN
jgi:hypothetical protein